MCTYYVAGLRLKKAAIHQGLCNVKSIIDSKHANNFFQVLKWDRGRIAGDRLKNEIRHVEKVRLFTIDKE